MEDAEAKRGREHLLAKELQGASGSSGPPNFAPSHLTHVQSHPRVRSDCEPHAERAEYLFPIRLDHELAQEFVRIFDRGSGQFEGGAAGVLLDESEAELIVSE